MSHTTVLPVTSTGRTQLFHVGHVVADIEQSREALRSFGYDAWTPVDTARSHACGPAGSGPFELLWTYSATGPLHYELIEVVHSPVPMPVGLHHAGFWSDDVAADRLALTREGMEFEFGLSFGHPDDDPDIAFMGGGSSPRLELVSSGMRQGMQAMFALAREGEQ